MAISKKAIIALIAVPIVIGGYFIYKQFSSNTANSKSDAPSPTPPPPNVIPKTNVTTTVDSDYPLGMGSKNSAVKSLQMLLNTQLAASGQPQLVADGMFGAKTLAALQSLTGKSSVDSAADMNGIKSGFGLVNAKSSNLDYAWSLVDAYAYNNDLSYMVVTRPLTLLGIYKDFTGKWQFNGKKVDMPVHQYSLDDYAPLAAMTDGTLRIKIINGDLAGMYSTEANIDLPQSINLT